VVNIEPATVKRLAEIENIVGIKEASGNVSQMASILNASRTTSSSSPADDAITLPLISLGGRGVISVVSNEIPAEMSQLDAARPPGRLSWRARDSPPLSSLMELISWSRIPFP